MLDGTVSIPLLLLLGEAARTAGVPEHLVRAETGSAATADEAARAPLPSLIRLWEHLSHALPPGRAGTHVADTAALGSLPAWDYLIVNGTTLTDALTHSAPYHQVVTASEKELAVHTRGDDLAVRYHSSAGDPRTTAAVHEYVLAYYLRRAREATRTDLTPLRVAFSHPAPADRSALARAFGTAALEFDAGVNELVFRAEDAHAPLPSGDPRLAELLRGHAGMLLSAAHPLPGWLDLFRTALDAELDHAAPSLGAVAARLASSPRTLQRRLGEHGTTWRAEVDRARHARARRLLSSGLTAEAVAARLGFSDDRALRKAFHRWSGHTPAQERRALARQDRYAARADLGTGAARP
ncbi:AraC family transcriptional regulator ligand-binding domain-containing protein [Nocardiopsis changdeensis]|uniref:AraC family transcriptional regulator ligand-binding domain-containing protein n=1 Tax=Nocardiopsis changdeensis TaxID=2831969 RepID=A0ABX8BKM3_9ACTN|nr:MULTISPECIES: AraC family transcriptional regulator [Nocardiopsis]QUX22756.1 AraC family transcriptional regulator ligand-binding domain-containing protein [Nocardiopsis changdeensis]QYX38699.1 AraC family transcriptional regulator [Nocardiopsis sp. MT53]